jgi:hypothetical protein
VWDKFLIAHGAREGEEDGIHQKASWPIECGVVRGSGVLVLFGPLPGPDDGDSQGGSIVHRASTLAASIACLGTVESHSIKTQSTFDFGVRWPRGPEEKH